LQDLSEDYKKKPSHLKFAKMNVFRNPKMSDKLKMIKYPQIAMYLDHKYFIYFKEIATKDEFDKFFTQTLEANTDKEFITSNEVL
jgi:hypothetical protein